ncbi:MAG TPA: hypothetical protein VD905_01255 [Flavobacteriales bacterium]|nr:hypothetical protein [Flavobacteriales bacterium]
MDYREFAKNKKIPDKYCGPILTALSHYPELKNAHIEFVLCQSLREAYNTRPAFSSIFKQPLNRQYRINILENAEPPLRDALFKNCTFECQIGIIAHELAHVLQFHNCSRWELVRLLVSFIGKKSKRLIERNADMISIQHGFGKYLYAHANHIRSIPGYIKQYPQLDENYLKPHEILVRMLHREGKFDGEIAI